MRPWGLTLKVTLLWAKIGSLMALLIGREKRTNELTGQAVFKRLFPK